MLCQLSACLFFFDLDIELVNTWWVSTLLVSRDCLDNKVSSVNQEERFDQAGPAAGRDKSVAEVQALCGRPIDTADRCRQSECLSWLLWVHFDCRGDVACGVVEGQVVWVCADVIYFQGVQCWICHCVVMVATGWVTYCALLVVVHGLDTRLGVLVIRVGRG